ncbi:MAG: hypothetical protein A3F77_14265 [Betaproteobacteria bacterium RIFCSPLOWO2_12_FULL_67_28]|nr:MAG: hypothetical protein A3F77_14265 [Betaproteobacteria bacterium RIFCSPLOWO2_12_FULL_67_28]
MKTLASAAHSCAALSCAAALLFSAHAAAQQRMYKCVDDKGKVYYTQVPPKECLGRDTQEISRQGRVTKRTEAALTPEQQAAREEEKKKQQEQEIAAREQKRKAQALLNTYSSEKDLEDARGRALKDNEVAIRESEKRIAGAEKRKKELEAEKEFYLKKPMPPKLAQDVKSNEAEIRNQRELLEAKKKQVADINARYDEDKRRYVELTKGAPASASKASASKTAAKK